MQRDWMFGTAAGLGFLIGAMLALHSGNALFFSAGTLAVTTLLAPLWWHRPRLLLFGLVLLFTVQDGFLDPLTKAVTVARVLPDVVLLVAFCARLVLAWQRREQPFPLVIAAPVGFILAVALVSLLLNHISLSQGVQGPYTLLRYALVFFLAAASQFRVVEVVAFVRVLAGVVLFEGLISLIQFAQLHLGGQATLFASFAVDGTMLHFNILGVFLTLVALTVLIVATIPASQFSRISMNFVLGVAIFTIVLATSRQSLAAFVFGVVAALIVASRRIHLARQWRPAAVTGAVMVGAMLLGFLALKAPYSGQATASTTGQGASSLVGQKLSGNELSLSADFYHNPRLYALVHGSGAVLQQSPLFGKGPGTYGSQPTFNDAAFYNNLDVGLLMSVPGSTLVADVEWMNVFGQLGLLGVAGFLWLFVSIGLLGYRVWRQSHDAVTQRLGLLCIALIPAFLFLGFFGPNFEIRQISIFLWLIPGLAMSLLRQEQTEPAPANASQPAAEEDPQLTATLKRARTSRPDIAAAPYISLRDA